MAKGAVFEAVNVYAIIGRGPCITRPEGVSKQRWADGERWDVGDGAVCDETGQVARVVGIEQDHPAYNDGSLLLRQVGPDQLVVEAGQTWRSIGRVVVEDGYHHTSQLGDGSKVCDGCGEAWPCRMHLALLGTHEHQPKGVYGIGPIYFECVACHREIQPVYSDDLPVRYELVDHG